MPHTNCTPFAQATHDTPRIGLVCAPTQWDAERKRPDMRPKCMQSIYSPAPLIRSAKPHAYRASTHHRPYRRSPLARERPALSPWLHEEVARRMEDRLQWIRQTPAAWCNWEAVRGGFEGHALVSARPKARCFVVETTRKRAKLPPNPSANRGGRAGRVSRCVWRCQTKVRYKCCGPIWPCIWWLTPGVDGAMAPCASLWMATSCFPVLGPTLPKSCGRFTQTWVGRPRARLYRYARLG